MGVFMFPLQQGLHTLMCKNMLISNPGYVVYNIYGATMQKEWSSWWSLEIYHDQVLPNSAQGHTTLRGLFVGTHNQQQIANVKEIKEDSYINSILQLLYIPACSSLLIEDPGFDIILWYCSWWSLG